MEQTIEFKIPEGYVFDKDNSTENVIRFKPIKKKITYQDVKNELFADTKKCYLEYAGDICSSRTIKYCNINTIMATSKNQIEQLLALNKLMNVAKYLNGDWEPDWYNSGETKWGISFNGSQKKIDISVWGTQKYGNVYFKLEELVYQAIEILGEEEVKKALGIFE